MKEDEQTIEEQLGLSDDLFITEEEEIVDPHKEGEEEEGKKVTIPEKFKDKSLEDVIASYQNLEKEFGRKNNEVGELRRLSDELLQLQLKEKEGNKEEEKVDFDSLVADPDAVINRALETNPEFRRQNETMQRMVREQASVALKARIPDAEEIAASPEFNAWVNASPVRQRMLREAYANFDVDVTEDILRTFTLTAKAKEKELEDARDATAKAALTKAKGEKGSAGSKGGGKRIYSRSQLMHLRLNEPAKFEALEKSGELMKAYAEGRVR